VRQLTSLDSQFLAMESPRVHGHVGGLAVYDPSTAPGGQLTVEDICRLVGQRLHLLKPFRWKLVDVPFGLDHPYWVDDPDFDLDFHIRESAVPPPGDERRVAETVARIFARPLDRSRPLWELYVIHGLPEGRIALLTKIHHAAVDGMSGAEILSILLDAAPEGRELGGGDEAGADERVPGQLEMLGRGLLGLPRQPVRALRGIPSTLPTVPDLPGLGMMPGGPTLARAAGRMRRLVRGTDDGGVLESTAARAPRTPFSGRISPHRRFAFGSLSLASVKALKNELDISVNDVVVALCATGLREWLLERDALPQQPLVALVPVSVRSREQMGTFGNRVSGMIVPIPTDVADPRARLMRAHEILRSAKDRHAALPASVMTDLANFIPPALHTRAARLTSEVTGRLRTPVNVVISNVPGPRVPLYCSGAQLEAHYPVSVITDGVGLNITVLSYLDNLDFGIVADRALVDDVWSLQDGLARSLDELREVIC
jgi:WS/DGAT/MGAT family acyltransferase